MNSSVLQPWQESVVREARSWLRTPFVHQQRLKGRGVDCAQFLAAVFEPYVGPVVIPPYAVDEFLHTSEEKLLRIVEQLAERADDQAPGYAVTFALGRRQHAHIAIIDEWPLVITPWEARVVTYVNVERDPRLNLSRVRGYWRPKLK